MAMVECHLRPRSERELASYAFSKALFNWVMFYSHRGQKLSMSTQCECVNMVELLWF